MIERLDETIDRVASELTEAAVDPALTMGVRDRLRESRPPRVTPMPMLAVVLATAAFAAVTFQLFGGFDSSDPPAPPAIAPAEATAGQPVEAPAQVQAVQEVREGPESDAEFPGIAGLTVEELTVPAMDVEPLDVASLQIAEIGDGEFEESR